MRGAAGSGGCRTSPRCRGAGGSWALIRCGCCSSTWRARSPRTARRGCSAAGCGWSGWTGRSLTCRTATRMPRSSAGPPASPGTARSRRPGNRPVHRRRAGAGRGPAGLLRPGHGGARGPQVLVLARRPRLPGHRRAHLVARLGVVRPQAGEGPADGTYLAELKPPRKKDGPPSPPASIEYTVHTTAGDGGEQTKSRWPYGWARPAPRPPTRGFAGRAPSCTTTRSCTSPATRRCSLDTPGRSDDRIPAHSHLFPMPAEPRPAARRPRNGQPGAGPASLPSGTSPAESSSTCSAPGSSPKATPLAIRPGTVARSGAGFRRISRRIY